MKPSNYYSYRTPYFVVGDVDIESKSKSSKCTDNRDMSKASGTRTILESSTDAWFNRADIDKSSLCEVIFHSGPTGI